MKQYPKFLYHKTLTAKVVRSKEEHDEHLDWHESPVAARLDVVTPEVVEKKKSKKQVK